MSRNDVGTFFSLARWWSSISEASAALKMVNAEDYRQRARRRLPRAVYDYVDGGAGAEGTVRGNEESFKRIRFRPRPMVDVSQRDQATTVLGHRVEMPVLLAPTGMPRLVHRDGELAAARAAARMGTVFSLSTAGSYSIEEVADAAKGAILWFQVYLWAGHDRVRSLVERAERAGYSAIILTIDTAVPAVKDRDLRNGTSVPPRLTLRNAFNTTLHPRWLIRHFLFAPALTLKNLTSEDSQVGIWTGPRLLQQLANPGATWEELRWLRSIWRGSLVVKGVLTKEDSQRSFDLGADAVVCSNHGGRVLDGLPASIDVLPRVLEAADRLHKEVYLDGGVRRGTDVVKAVALGARACLIGRPWWWGLAVGGENGVVSLLALLKKEIDSALGLLGRARLADLDVSVLDFTDSPWHYPLVNR